MCSLPLDWVTASSLPPWKLVKMLREFLVFSWLILPSALAFKVYWVDEVMVVYLIESSTLGFIMVLFDEFLAFLSLSVTLSSPPICSGRFLFFFEGLVLSLAPCPRFISPSVSKFSDNLYDSSSRLTLRFTSSLSLTILLGFNILSNFLFFRLRGFEEIKLFFVCSLATP